MSKGGLRLNAGNKFKYGEETEPMRIPKSLIGEIRQYIQTKGYKIPLFSSKVSAGFPSPADDYIDDKIDLNSYLIPHPASTFFVRVEGNSMVDAGIKEGDLLIIDRSLDPTHGNIIVVVIDGHMTVKTLNKKINGKFNLLPANAKFEPIEVDENSNTHIWGVVTNVIHKI